MTKFHESVRSVLTEVQRFFGETVSKEKLPRKAIQHRERILDLIHAIRHEYPELFPNDSEPDIRDDSSFPDLSARALTNIKKAGFLNKRRKKETLFQRGSYQRRYCVIQRQIFYYYVSPTDKKQAGAFKLKGYKFRKAPYLPEDDQKKDLSFELSCPGKRSFQFLAETSQDFKEWKDAIKECSGIVDKDKQDDKDSANIDEDFYVDGDLIDDNVIANDEYLIIQNDDDVGDDDYDDNYEKYLEEDDVVDRNVSREKPALVPRTRQNKPTSSQPPINHSTVKPPTNHSPMKPQIQPRPYSRQQEDYEVYDDCETIRPIGNNHDYLQAGYNSVDSGGGHGDAYAHRKRSDDALQHDASLTEFYYSDSLSRSDVESDNYEDAASTAPKKTFR